MFKGSSSTRQQRGSFKPVFGRAFLFPRQYPFPHRLHQIRDQTAPFPHRPDSRPKKNVTFIVTVETGVSFAVSQTRPIQRVTVSVGRHKDALPTRWRIPKYLILQYVWRWLARRTHPGLTFPNFGAR